MENRNAKSLLAKLMAAEDLNVEYSETATTAAFDTEGRTLIMPLLKNVSDRATDLFLGHEVGHALYTPQGRIKDIAKESRRFFGFVNITEDARIEKMIQIKFPGLRRCFYDGYTELMDKNFFGTDGKDVNSYSFIDRLNLHFKAGIRASIDFSAEEEIYVNRMENLSSFDEAVDLARELYDLDKEDSDSASETDINDSDNEDFKMGSDENESDAGDMSSDKPIDFDESENSDEDGESGSEGSGEKSGEDDDSAEAADSSTSDEEKDTNDFEGISSPTAGGAADDSLINTDPISSEESLGPITQDAFDEAVKESIDHDTSITYCRIPTLPLEEIIIPIEEIHSVIDESIKDNGGDGLKIAIKEYKTFSTEQKSLISYLVKEFEMRKSADEHKRTSVGTTGVLNPNKLHAYKFSEDIFLRNTIIADGKSHGFIMYIDWSGSMANCMGKTIDQLMLLALFCKKANIPFDCFAFSSHYYRVDDLVDGRRTAKHEQPYYAGNVKELAVGTRFKLLHLLSSQLNSQKFTKAMIYMTYLRESFTARYSYGQTGCYLPNALHLGGTPLNEAVLTAFTMVPMFRKKYNVQIVNTVFLTDGAGSRLRTTHKTVSEDNPTGIDHASANGARKLQITDMVTKKNYNVDEYGDDTGLLLEILKDRTNCRITGFFINTEHKRNLMGNLRCIKPNLTYDDMEDVLESLKVNQFARMETQGYEEFYVIDGKKMGLENTELEITEDMSKAKMKTAFIKNRKAKLVSKKMLSQFAEFVS